MDKIFVIVWHVLGGVDAGTPTSWLIHPFTEEHICRSAITSAMTEYDRDKQIRRDFYVDCMRFSDIPQGLPTR